MFEFEGRQQCKHSILESGVPPRLLSGDANQFPEKICRTCEDPAAWCKSEIELAKGLTLSSRKGCAPIPSLKADTGYDVPRKRKSAQTKPCTQLCGALQARLLCVQVFHLLPHSQELVSR